MSGYYNDSYSDLDGSGRQEETGSGLRAMLEEALGEIKNLRGELEKVQSGQRQTSVTDLLESKGIDPAVAQIIPEGANPAEWLNEFGHLFGSNLDEDAGELQTPEEQDEPDEQLLAEQAAWEAANGLSSTSSGTTTSVSDPFAKLESFQSAEEMIAFISSQTEGRD